MRLDVNRNESLVLPSASRFFSARARPHARTKPDVSESVDKHARRLSSWRTFGAAALCKTPEGGHSGKTSVPRRDLYCRLVGQIGRDEGLEMVVENVAHKDALETYGDSQVPTAAHAIVEQARDKRQPPNR